MAVGSVGRLEALEASDLDVIPILQDTKALEQYLNYDKKLRDLLAKKLNIKVSKGRYLTSPINIDNLIDPETIGGDNDDTSALTKRILILTESQHAGGELSAEEIRKKVLLAYAAPERTRGRHVLTLCNDIARYYRTLCIDYKSKIDVELKDWCTRNLKLRHSRKLWYFSSIMAISVISKDYPHGKENYIKKLLNAFSMPPCYRLIMAVDGWALNSLREILERFVWFLEFMSKKNHRDALAQIEHHNRYKSDLNNPFPGLKMNSDIMHENMLKVLIAAPNDINRKIFDWFLF